MKRTVLLAALALWLGASANANANLNSWSGLAGLDAASGAQWIREYTNDTLKPGTMYAATYGDGVKVTSNDGISWTDMSAGLDVCACGKDVFTVFKGNKLYAGTSAGVFAYNGSKWEPEGLGQEADPAHPVHLNASVQAVYSPPVPLKTIVAGTFNEGVWWTTDDGATWHPPAPGNGMPTNETVWSIDAAIPGFLFAATASGVYRSTDMGKTWSPASDGITGYVLRVTADPGNPNIIYAYGNDGIYRSTSGGIKWASANGAGATALHGAPVRALTTISGDQQTKLYAGTTDGMWVGTTGNGPAPGGVSWKHVTNDGLISGNQQNTIFWALLKSYVTLGTFFAGTQSNGGYALSLQMPINTAAPLISGTMKSGMTLSSTTGAWSGTPEINYEYQWQQCDSAAANTANCTDIKDATESTYALTDTDISSHIRVVVTASNAFPTFKDSKPSAITIGTVGIKDGPRPGDTNSSTGDTKLQDPNKSEPQPGDVVELQGAFFNPPATTTTYQFDRCTGAGSGCAQIPGLDASKSTYNLTLDDIGKYVCGHAIGANVHGAKMLGCAGAVGPVLAPDPHNITPPSISGAAWVGESLIGNVGKWEYAETNYKRSWYVCEDNGDFCEPAGHGTTYTITPDDLGHTVKLTVAADSNGDNMLPNPVELTTALSAVVTNQPPPEVKYKPGQQPDPQPNPDPNPSPQPNPDPNPNPQPQPSPQPDPNPQPNPQPQPKPGLAPALTKLSLKAKTLKASAKLELRYTLSAGASLDVQFRKGKKAIGTVVVARRTGSGSVKLALKVKGHRLKAGSYQLVVVPVDAAGRRGAAKSLAFKVKR